MAVNDAAADAALEAAEGAVAAAESALAAAASSTHRNMSAAEDALDNALEELLHAQAGASDNEW